jgi:hypothetical protein
MRCVIGIVLIVTIWPASAYFLYKMLGYGSTGNKIWINSSNVMEKYYFRYIPFTKLKSIKENKFNIFINIPIGIFRAVLSLVIILPICAVWMGLALLGVWCAGSCF